MSRRWCIAPVLVAALSGAHGCKGACRGDEETRPQIGIPGRLPPFDAGAGRVDGAAARRARTEPIDSRPRRARQEHRAPSDPLALSCPMELEGTRVELFYDVGGVGLTFTRDGDLAELRRRVRRLADMYGVRQGRWRGFFRTEGDRWDAGPVSVAGPLPGAVASVTDLPRGARVILRPTIPGQLGFLERHLRLHRRHMARGECFAVAGAEDP